jgi:dihydrolipoamide dehydrogenase
MTPRALPGSLLVVGSGAIGIEFASFYRSLGVEVTLVEMLDRLLPLEDAEVSAFVRKAFEKRGVVVHTSAVVQELGKAGAGVVAGIRLENRTLELRAERVIAAVGIVGNVEDLGIEGTRVRVHGSHVVTDEWCQTDEPGVYAIGDVAGPPWLAHKASHEGILCVERIAGVPGVHPIDVTRVPSCTYGSPQVASVGLTEEDARGRGHSVKVGRFSFRGNGKAIALGAPDGFVKTVFDESTGELLGAHLVGPEVTELIQGFAIAKTLETTEAELVSAVFAHPTLSEALQESVLASLGRAIHA